jgi:hypothetical protein
MKKIYYYFTLVVILLSVYSCEIDNYDGPNATIQGQILDQDGNPLQTEQGATNMRIKMEELSWQKGDSTVSISPTYLNIKQDGSYVNSKIFSGTYKMTPVEGAFFPYNAKGDTMNIKGIVTKNFTVTPYLKIEWILEPYLDADNYIRAAVKFTRNSLAGATQPTLNNALLCISTTQYVGSNNYDSQLVNGTVAITNNQEGQVISFMTSRAVKYQHATYYVRIGVCCSDTYKKYNYTDIKTVIVP